MGAKHESENRDPKEESTGHIGKGLEYQPEHEGPHTRESVEPLCVLKLGATII